MWPLSNNEKDEENDPLEESASLYLDEDDDDDAVLKEALNPESVRENASRSSSSAVWQLSFIGDWGIVLLLLQNESPSPDSAWKFAASSSLGEFEAPSELRLLLFLGSGGRVFLLPFAEDGDGVSSPPLEPTKERFECFLTGTGSSGGSPLTVQFHGIATETSLQVKCSWARVTSILLNFPLPALLWSSCFHTYTSESSLALIIYLPSGLNEAAIWLFALRKPVHVQHQYFKSTFLCCYGCGNSYHARVDHILNQWKR